MTEETVNNLITKQGVPLCVATWNQQQKLPFKNPLEGINEILNMTEIQVPKFQKYEQNMHLLLHAHSAYNE